MDILADEENRELTPIDEDDDDYDWTEDSFDDFESPSYRYDEDKDIYTLSDSDFEQLSNIMDKINKIEKMKNDLTSEQLEEFHSENFDYKDVEEGLNAKLRWLSEKLNIE